MAASAPPSGVTLTIDGQEVTVPRGTLVIEAARQIGIEIPVFCYHPKLSLVGACRMCSCEIQMPAPAGGAAAARRGSSPPAPPRWRRG